MVFLPRWRRCLVSSTGSAWIVSLRQFRRKISTPVAVFVTVRGLIDRVISDRRIDQKAETKKRKWSLAKERDLWSEEGYYDSFLSKSWKICAMIMPPTAANQTSSSSSPTPSPMAVDENTASSVGVEFADVLLPPFWQLLIGDLGIKKNYFKDSQSIISFFYIYLLTVWKSVTFGVNLNTGHVRVVATGYVFLAWYALRVFCPEFYEVSVVFVLALASNSTKNKRYRHLLEL